MVLNLGWPPISHNFIVTLPLVIFLILNPTVGIISSVNWPDFWKNDHNLDVKLIIKIIKKTYSNNIYKSCLSRILETNQCQLHLFFPEQTSNPI